MRLHIFRIAVCMRLLCAPFFPSRLCVLPCLFASCGCFRLPGIVLFPIVDCVSLISLVNPYAKAIVEKSVFLALPVGGKFYVFPVHAGQKTIRFVLGGKKPQDLQGARGFKAKTLHHLFGFGMLPEARVQTNVGIHLCPRALLTFMRFMDIYTSQPKAFFYMNCPAHAAGFSFTKPFPISS